MSTINDGGPAFPMQDQQSIHAWAQARIECMGLATTAERDAAYIQARAEAIGGMSLRDYAAIEAMKGFISGHFSHYGHENYWPREDIASEAYAMADAMLKARAQKGGAA